jgi:hypothetical protein
MKKVYRKVKKTVLFDSRDRNPLTTQSKYSLTLPKTLENVYSVTLKSAEVPFTWYVFSESYGNTSFTLNNKLISIPAGNYTGTTFAEAIQDALAVEYPSVFTVSYSYYTNKLTITCSAAGTYTFDFTKPVQNASSCGAPQPTNSTTTWWGLGYFMGFNKKIYTFTNLVGSQTSMVSEFCVQLNDENYILLELDFINKEDETSIDNRLSGRVDGCFAKVPINGNSGDIIFFRELCCSLNRSVMSPPLSQLRVLNIKWRFHDGQLVEFNNVDHSFTLEFELLDNNFDEYSSLDFSH